MGQEDIRLHLRYLINKFRQEHGKPALELSPELCEGSKAHSESRVEKVMEIMERKIPGHTEGVYWKGWEGENIGWHEGSEHPFQVAERIFNKWLENPIHRQNILNARNCVGVDIAHRWVQGGRKRIFMTARFK